MATSAMWQVLPGGVNIVPEQVRFSIDLRRPDQATLQRLTGRIREECGRIATRRGLQVVLDDIEAVPPAPMDEQLQKVIGRAAQEQGASARPIPSGAGHDSQTWAPHIPTAMIFVPGVDGRSHCPEEFTSAQDCAVGASVLAGTLRELAYRPAAIRGVRAHARRQPQHHREHDHRDPRVCRLVSRADTEMTSNLAWPAVDRVLRGGTSRSRRRSAHDRRAPR